MESLAALFYLGAFLCFVRFRLVNRQAWLWATLLIFVAGLFAKQTIVTFPLLILAFDLIGPTAQRKGLELAYGIELGTPETAIGSRNPLTS